MCRSIQYFIVQFCDIIRKNYAKKRKINSEYLFIYIFKIKDESFIKIVLHE